MKRNEPKKNQSKTMLPPAFPTLPSLFCWANTPELAGFDPFISNDHQTQAGWEQIQIIPPCSAHF